MRRPKYDEKRDWIIVYTKIPIPDGKEPYFKRVTFRRQSKYPWDLTRDNVVRDLFPTYFAGDVAKVLNLFWPEPVKVSDKMVITRAQHLGVARGRRSAKSEKRR